MPDLKGIIENAKPTIETPRPLESSLPPVGKLAKKMLPSQLSRFVFDVAERTQCPPEYVAVASLVALATTVGSKYAIHPKQHDPWEVRINLWGATIGPPSAMKSPALKEAMRPLVELEIEHSEFIAAQNQEREIIAELAKTVSSNTKKEAAKLLEEGKRDEALAMMQATQTEEKPTKAPRYIVNDATVEKLGELLNENPNGLLLFRDELAGLLAKLSQEDGQMDRAFYLECFDGNGRYTYDRIGRGTIVIENCMLSVLGGIQPSKISKLIRLAMNGSADDGLVQRLQLTVWPDLNRNWTWKDQMPDKNAYAAYRGLIREFDKLPVGLDGPLCLRFTAEAQGLFGFWMADLHYDLRHGDYHPVVQSHLAKSPKTVASLALLFELTAGGRSEVGLIALEQALLWAGFLKSHALRLYGISMNSVIANARLILHRREKLKQEFTVRDVRRKGWIGLTESSDVAEAVECLVDHNYLIELHVRSGATGGRPTIQYRWSPLVGSNS